MNPVRRSNFIFEKKRYDVGNKLGFLQATIEFALERDDLKNDFKAYLLELMENEIGLLQRNE